LARAAQPSGYAFGLMVGTFALLCDKFLQYGDQFLSSQTVPDGRALTV
jgi:hypothetical protein